MVNIKNDEKIIFDKIETVTTKGWLDDDVAAEKLKKCDYLFDKSLWILVASLVFSFFVLPFVCISDLVRDLISLFLFVSSIVICAWPLFIKSRIRKDIGFEEKAGFYMRDSSFFENYLRENPKQIELFLVHEKELLLSTFIWCKNSLIPAGGIRVIFGEKLVMWVSSLLLGWSLGQIKIEINELSQFVEENKIFLFLMWYSVGFFVCILDKIFSESMGVSQKQRREYVILLLKCAIRKKEEEMNQSPVRD